jgi:hypothetical protein
VLTEAGVERYDSDKLDDGFGLQLPRSDVDYRYIEGTGEAGKGMLYLFDATAGVIDEYRKLDGSYRRSWAPAAAQPQMTDVRAWTWGGRTAGQWSRG